MRVSGLPALLLSVFIVASPEVFAQDVRSWCPDGQRAFSAKNYDAANLALSSCLYSPPEDARQAANGYVLRGETYMERLDYIAALGDLDRAVELDPDNAIAWREKAWAHYKKNELHPAIAAITQSLEVDPNITESQHVNAQILTALGRGGLAMDAYDLGYAFETRERVQKLQQELARQDYYKGAPDGIYGAQTRDALRACIANKCSLPY